MAATVTPVGDAALLVELGEGIDRRVSAEVAALDRRLRDAPPKGLVETTPAFRSLLVAFDPLATDHREMADAVAAAQSAASGQNASGQDASGQNASGQNASGQDAASGQNAAPEENAAPPKLWRFPAAYGGAVGPDLAEVAEATGLSEERVVALHLAVEHHVYMLGFLPGAPYLGDLPKEIDLPRRAEPRVATPAGSVAIAIGLTVIYPVESPGGWRLLGRTPVRLFDVADDPPALLSPGDAIRFERASAEETASLAARAAEGAWRPEWSPRDDV